MSVSALTSPQLKSSRYPHWTGSALPPVGKTGDESDDTSSCICCSVSCIMQELARVQQRVSHIESILVPVPSTPQMLGTPQMLSTPLDANVAVKHYRRKNKKRGKKSTSLPVDLDIDVVD